MSLKGSYSILSFKKDRFLSSTKFSNVIFILIATRQTKYFRWDNLLPAEE